MELLVSQGLKGKFDRKHRKTSRGSKKFTLSKNFIIVIKPLLDLPVVTLYNFHHTFDTFWYLGNSPL